MTDLSHFQHPRFARMHERMSAESERGTAQHRDRMLAGLTGRVIEVGAGHATALPVEDNGFDAAVTLLVLCRSPIRRGTERDSSGPETHWGASLFEHIRSEKPWFELHQDAHNRPGVPKAAVIDAGFACLLAFGTRVQAGSVLLGCRRHRHGTSPYLSIRADTGHRPPVASRKSSPTVPQHRGHLQGQGQALRPATCIPGG
jgi:hypothetical protein